MEIQSEKPSVNQVSHSSFSPFREPRTSDNDEFVGQAIVGACSSVDEATGRDFAMDKEPLSQQNDTMSPKSAVLVPIQEDEPLDEKSASHLHNVVEWRSWALQVNTLLNDFHQKFALLECRIDYLMADCELRKEFNNKISHYQNSEVGFGNEEPISKARHKCEDFDPVGKDWVPLNVETSSVSVRPVEQDVTVNGRKTSCRFTSSHVEGGNFSQRDIGIGDHVEAPSCADAIDEAASEENRRWGKPGFLQSQFKDKTITNTAKVDVEPPAKLRWAGSTTRAAHLLQAGADPVELETASRRSCESQGFQQDRLSPAHALRRLNNFLENVGASKHQALKEPRLLGSPASDASEII